MNAVTAAAFAVLLALRLAAQPPVDTLVERIEKWAALEERRLGLDTRLTAAERLRVVAPAAARRLLEGGFPALQQDPGTDYDYFTYRLLRDYAAIDLDAAERAFASVKDRVSAYTALIEQATRQQDFTRAVRLVRAALRDGHYSLGATSHLVEVLASEDRARAVALQDELVRAFPAGKATYSNVRSLLTYVSQAPPIDAARGRKTARLAFQALDRPGIRKTPTAAEITATFTLGDRRIETTNTYETVLLPAAAFLAVFDAREYRKREASFPAWKSGLAGLTAGDLPALMKAPRVLRRRPEPRPDAPPPPPRRDLEAMQYDELLAYAATLAPELQYGPLLVAARRPGITDAQREPAFRLALESLALGRSDGMRCLITARACEMISESRIDSLIRYAVPPCLATLDTGARSQDRMLVAEHQRGEFGKRYASLARMMDRHGIVLPEPHPAIEAQRALREIEKLRLRAQDFELLTQDGKPVRLSDLRGQVVFLDFWATWCEPCRRVLPEVARLHREWSGKGVVVLGVDDESPAAIRAFAAKNDLPYPTLIDRGRKVHELFGVEGIPAAIVIGRDGSLVERVPFPHNGETFRAALRKAGME